MQVLVVGAGAAGLSVSYAASSAGHQVKIIDPAPTNAAAHVAAGRLAPVVEVEFGESEMTKLCLAANHRWKSWAEELRPFATEADWYQRSGMIVAARYNDDAAAIRRLADYQTSLGLDVETLSARALRKLEPALSPSVFGGMLVQGDHMVDNRIMLSALRKACSGSGTEFLTERALRVGATRVDTDKGSYSADAVVLAAGAWTSQVDLMDGLRPVTVYPVKGQILRLQGASTSVFPRYPIDGLDVYLVPRRSGELVVGASVEDLGFDATITAGAVHELLKRARELVPGVDEMSLVETAVGFRPATQNHTPIVGPLGPDGPFVATGLYRNGILLAPTVGDEALKWLQGQPLSDCVKPFAPPSTQHSSEANSSKQKRIK